MSNAADLPHRLRRLAEQVQACNREMRETVCDAAVEIERLRAEVKAKGIEVG